jgi:hypothetical protein
MGKKNVNRKIRVRSFPINNPNSWSGISKMFGCTNFVQLLPFQPYTLSSGLNTFPLSYSQILPDLSSTPRAVQLISVIGNFYATGVSASPAVTVQIFIINPPTSSTGTPSYLPVSPIVALSQTNPRRVKGSYPVSTTGFVGVGSSLTAISLAVNTAAAQTVYVDWKFIFLLTRDGLTY